MTIAFDTAAPTLDCITAIVRGVGERTENACAATLRNLLGESAVTVIHERPFIKALSAGMEIGRDAGRELTLCVDGDLLLSAQKLREMFALIQNAPAEEFHWKGSILDKFFGCERPGGAHLYRTADLGTALDVLRQLGETRRPETTLIKQMAERGKAHRLTFHAVGLHDYEQFYRDIFRTGFNHTWKHRASSSAFEQFWTAAAAADPDYTVALLGLRAARVFDNADALDAGVFPSDISSLLSLTGLTEKEPLADNTDGDACALAALDSFQPHPAAAALQAHISGLATRKSPLQNLFSSGMALVGPVGFVPWVVGKGLKRIGDALESWAENRR